MSTPVSQPIPKPSWKEEVNRKLEAHKNRRGIAVVEQRDTAAPSSAVSDRAAQAAARVAARYARTPSFSEMQAAEARAALRAAEEATRKALEAQAVAQAALAELTCSEDEDEFEEPEIDSALFVAEPEQAYRPLTPFASAPAPLAVPPVPSSAAPTSTQVEVRWEPDLPVRAEMAEPVHTHAAAELAASLSPSEIMEAETVETVEPAQPIPANLIQFPRELVATRRMRPRLASAPHGAADEVSAQLSIFEVDPESISTEPTPVTETAEPSCPAGAEWSGLQLDSHPADEAVPQFEQAAGAVTLELAPLSLRLMSTAVDCGLILLLAAGAAAGVVNLTGAPLPLKTAEAGGLGLLFVVGLVYHLGWLMTTNVTPGMKYAGIALCTFDDGQPGRAQLRERLLAMIVSLLPLGLGLAWSAFDENHLCWHDRLSRTYLRKC